MTIEDKEALDALVLELPQESDVLKALLEARRRVTDLEMGMCPWCMDHFKVKERYSEDSGEKREKRELNRVKRALSG